MKFYMKILFFVLFTQSLYSFGMSDTLREQIKQDAESLIANAQGLPLNEIRMVESFFQASIQLTKKDILFRQHFILFQLRSNEFSRKAFDHNVSVDYDKLNSIWNEVLDLHESRQDIYALWCAIIAHISDNSSKGGNIFFEGLRENQAKYIMKTADEYKNNLVKAVRDISFRDHLSSAEQIRNSIHNMLKDIRSFVDAESGLDLFEKCGFLGEKLLDVSLVDFEKALELRASNIALMELTCVIMEMYRKALQDLITIKAGKQLDAYFVLSDGILIADSTMIPTID